MESETWTEYKDEVTTQPNIMSCSDYYSTNGRVYVSPLLSEDVNSCMFMVAPTGFWIFVGISKLSANNEAMPMRIIFRFLIYSPQELPTIFAL